MATQGIYVYNPKPEASVLLRRRHRDLFAMSRSSAKPRSAAPTGPKRPTANQLAWLCRGIDQPGGKLPLFDEQGKRINAQTIRSCMERGWAEPWFSNPLKPDWLVCRLTEAGREAMDAARAEDGTQDSPSPDEEPDSN